MVKVSASFSLNINEESAGIVSLQRYDLVAGKGLSRKEDDRTVQDRTGLNWDGRERTGQDRNGMDGKASAQIDGSAA